MTLNDLITQSLMAFNAIDPDEPLDATIASRATDALNIIVDEWNAEGLLVYATTRESFALTSGVASYQWGLTGTSPFNTARPVRIVKAFITDGGNDYPVELIGENEYEDILLKTTAGRPFKLWYNPTYPKGTLYLYYAPDSTYTLNIDSEKDLIDFSTLSATINLPPEYLAALKWNLAVELCPNHQKQPTPFMMFRADETLRTLRRLNIANKVEPIVLGLPTVRPSTGRGTILDGYDY